MKFFWAAMSIFRQRRLSRFQSLGAALSLALALAIFTSACKLKARNQEGLDKLLNSAPEISKFDVPSTRLQAGASINIPIVINSGSAQVSKLTLQYAADGVSFSDVAQVDPTSTVITWNVPQAELSAAKLQLIAVNDVGKQSVKQSSSFSTTTTPINNSLVSLFSASPTQSTSALFSISDCTDRASIYVSESKVTPLSSAKGWITCSTTPGAIPFTLSSTDGIKTVYFWTQDEDENISDPVTVSVILDKSAPTLSFTSSPLSGSTQTGGSVFILGFNVTDTLSSISSLKLQYSSDNGTSYTDVATLSTSATSYNWTVPTVTLSTAKLKLVAVDQAGNSGNVATSTFSIVASAPTVSITSPTAGAYANASNVASFPMSGACSSNGGAVNVSATDGVNTATASTTCNTLGSPNWSTTINLSTLNAGSVTLSASHTDGAGVTVNSSTVAITKDVIAPTLAISSPTIVSVINNSSQAAYSVTGSCSENGRSVSVSATDGTNTVSATPTCNTGGAPQFSTTLNLTGLTDGTITFSASQTDVAGNSGSASTVAVTKDVAIPTVSSVSTTNTTGTYVFGSTVSIQVAFSKSVIVTGTPQLNINTGASSGSRNADYVSGSGSNTLTFTYTVQNRDYSSQLNYLNTTALSLNSGTIKDSTNNDATLTLPATGSAMSLAGTSTTAAKTIKVNSAKIGQSTLTTALVGGNNCTTASSCKKTQTTTIRLTSIDSLGNTIPIGGLSIGLSASTGAGVSTGTIGSVTDNGDGTYQATFTATGSGTATTISATIAGSGGGSGTSLGTVISTTTITVTNAAPVITPLATQTYPLDGGTPPALQGSSVTLATATDADGDTITLSCTYRTLGLHTSDPNYAAAGTNCNTLNTITSSGSPATVVTGKLVPTTTGSLIWTPTYTQRGTYQFTINGTDGVANASSQTVTLAVRAGYTSTNLLSALDALNSTNASGLSASTPSAPLSSSDTTTSWLNLLSSASNGALTFGTTNPWGGTGQASTSSVDPYTLSFNKNNSDSLSLGTVMNTATQFSTEAWVKPSPLPSASPVPIIIGNGGGTGDGFVLRQSQITPDRAEFVMGQKYYSYQDLVLSLKPIGYWRFEETSGTTLSDKTAYGNNCTLTGTAGTTYILNQTTLLNGDSNPSSFFNGGKASCGTSNQFTFANTTAFSVAFLFKPSVVDTSYRRLISHEPAINQGWTMTFQSGHGLIVSRANSTTDSTITSAGGISAGNTYFVVVTYDGTTLKRYLNNSMASLASSLAIDNTTSDLTLGNSSATNSNASSFIDEVAIFNYALSSQDAADLYNTYLNNASRKPYPGNAILADKPTGYWRLGEKSGAVAADLSGNNNSGTYTGGYTLNQTSVLSNSGDSDSSTLFDGSTGYVTISDHASYASSYASAEAWFYPKSLAAYSAIVNRRTAANSGGIALELDTTGTLRAYVQVGGTWYNAFKSGITINNWYHAVATYNGTQVSLTVNNGTPNSTAISGTLDNPTSPTVMIGKSVNNTTYFNGTIDEVALYNYALSPTQIAAHYNSGNGAGWWTCQSQTQLSQSNWNLLSTLYNGTTARLFVNGQQECSVTPGTTYSGAVANTVAGSNPGRTSNFWTGLLSSLKIFGTSNATAPATSTSIRTNFDSEANRFRSVPIENVVTNGLVLNLDAANAKQGLAPYTNGCASTDLGWFDLSPSGLGSRLLNFSSCGSSSGWVGSGTTSNPYALAFDGTNDYVQLSSALNAYPMTITTWFKTTMNTANYPAIITNYSASNGYNLYFNNGNICAWYYKDGSSRIYNGDTTSLCTAGYNSGSWHYASYVVGPSGGTLYVDGNQVATLPWVGTPGATTSTQNPSIGNYGGSIFPGSIATLQVYNRDLNLQEIKQNCLAQEGRFTNTPQSICAAP